MRAARRTIGAAPTRCVPCSRSAGLWVATRTPATVHTHAALPSPTPARLTQVTQSDRGINLDLTTSDSLYGVKEETLERVLYDSTDMCTRAKNNDLNGDGINDCEGKSSLYAYIDGENLDCMDWEGTKFEPTAGQRHVDAPTTDVAPLYLTKNIKWKPYVEPDNIICGGVNYPKGCDLPPHLGGPADGGCEGACRAIDPPASGWRPKRQPQPTRTRPFPRLCPAHPELVGPTRACAGCFIRTACGDDSHIKLEPGDLAAHGIGGAGTAQAGDQVVGCAADDMSGTKMGYGMPYTS